MHIVKVMSVISWMFFFSASPLNMGLNEKIPWLSLQESEVAYKKEKKPILIDLYTNWCGWCKVMDKKTYANKNVIGYLNEKFYTVKLNAETRESVSWSGKIFRFNAVYKANDIALYLTQGQLSFPTTVIIPIDGSEPQAIPGYLTPGEIEVLLKYFGDNQFGKISFEDYSRNFKHSW